MPFAFDPISPFHLISFIRMDPESSEVLNNLVMRWRARTEQWQQISHAQSDLDKLEADIEKLTRHVEGLRGIHNTLQTLETYRTSLIQLSALAKKAHDETLGKQTQPALDAPHEPLQNMTREEDTGLAKLDSDLAAIDEEMRQWHCHHEDFVLKYMQVAHMPLRGRVGVMGTHVPDAGQGRLPYATAGHASALWLPMPQAVHF
jgi:hypothetical protein